MKFQLIGSTNFAWAEFLREFPPEHVSALNTGRQNVQSLASAIKLLTALDGDTELGKNAPPPYILELFGLVFWFELPFSLIEEVLSKTRVRGINIPQARTDNNKGMLSGSLNAWVELVDLRGKPYVSKEFNVLAGLVESVFERESLSTLLN